MHGLSNHGVMGTPVASLAAMDHGDHGAMPAGHPAPDGGHTGMAMLCLAILLTTIVVAWMVRFLRRRPIFTLGRLEHRFPPRPGTTHPPPLARFSVMRC